MLSSGSSKWFLAGFRVAVAGYYIWFCNSQVPLVLLAGTISTPFMCFSNLPSAFLTYISQRIVPLVQAYVSQCILAAKSHNKIYPS